MDSIPRKPKRSILLVDDHAGFRQMVAEVLELESGTYDEASNGLEAIEACHSETCIPDLILMDVEMPKLNGIDATRQIVSRFPEAQIIILTQHDDHWLRRIAMDAGASHYVSKADLSPLTTLVTS